MPSVVAGAAERSAIVDGFLRLKRALRTGAFRPAKPLSRSCQKRICGSPSFQQRKTRLPSITAGKSTRPSLPLLGSTPSARSSSTYSFSRCMSFSISCWICTSSSWYGSRDFLAFSFLALPARSMASRWRRSPRSRERATRSETMARTKGSVALACSGVKTRRCTGRLCKALLPEFIGKYGISLVHHAPPAAPTLDRVASPIIKYAGRRPQ